MSLELETQNSVRAQLFEPLQQCAALTGVCIILYPTLLLPQEPWSWVLVFSTLSDLCVQSCSLQEGSR